MVIKPKAPSFVWKSKGPGEIFLSGLPYSIKYDPTSRRFNLREGELLLGGFTRLYDAKRYGELIAYEMIEIGIYQ